MVARFRCCPSSDIPALNFSRGSGEGGGFVVVQSAHADVFVAAAGRLSSQREEGGCELASVISKTLWCEVLLGIPADENLVSFCRMELIRSPR